MGLETGTYVNDLNTANPGGTDAKSQGDDHIRLLKTCIKNSFPFSTMGTGLMTANGAAAAVSIASAADIVGYIGSTTVTNAANWTNAPALATQEEMEAGTETALRQMSPLRVKQAVSTLDASEITYTPAGAGAVDTTTEAKLRESVSVKDFGAIPGSLSDQSTYFHAAFDAAKAAGIGIVEAEGTYRFTNNLVLRDSVELRGRSRQSLILEMDGCYVTNEIIANSNPACKDTGLTATIVSVNGTDQYGVVLAGVQYSEFDIKIDGFNGTNSIGLYCTSIYDSGGSAWRYVTNNIFANIEVEDCYKGIVLTKHASDPATYGANFNIFIGGYVKGYTVTGIHVEYGEANTFLGTRCTTNIGSNSVAWLIEDSVNTLDSCTADGSFGGTVPGTSNTYGFPYGRNGDTSTVGFKFVSGSNGSLLINPRGDGVYDRITFDSTTTRNNIDVIGRADYNWFSNLRSLFIHAQSNTDSNTPLTVENTGTGTVVLSRFKSGSSTYDAQLRMLSNGAIEFGSVDADTKFIAGNTTGTLKIRGRFVGSTGDFRPEVDNDQNLGTASYRWKEVFAGIGTINISDAREKQQVRSLSDKEHAVAVKLKSTLRAFKFNEAVAAKGDAARTHFGIIAQDVKAAFESEGLVAENYGMLCYDEWDEIPEEVDESGAVVQQHRPAGNRYGIRYDQLLSFIIAVM